MSSYSTQRKRSNCVSLGVHDEQEGKWYGQLDEVVYTCLQRHSQNITC